MNSQRRSAQNREAPIQGPQVSILKGQSSALDHGLIDHLQAQFPGRLSVTSTYDFERSARNDRPTDYVYMPSMADAAGMVPNLAEAERVFRVLVQHAAKSVVVLSSALIYGIGPGRLPLVSEDYTAPRKYVGSIADAWKFLEDLAIEHLRAPVTLTILRPATVIPSQTLLSRFLTKRVVPAVAGHDPILQLLSPEDLAQAIRCVLSQSVAGIFNVAPDCSVPTRMAIRAAGSKRIPLPRTILRLAKSRSALDYLRYPWTVCNQKLKKQSGFAPTKTSLAAMLDARNGNNSLPVPEPPFDEFGMDRKYIDRYGRTLFKFLADYYWRIEERGIEHIPLSGRGILVGMHRGFMPWDGVMALHLIARRTGRYPRFLIHPGLLIFPFLANFMTKLGGVLACQASAHRILEKDELLGIFPEGIHGAFTLYRDAYKLQGFARDAFVKMAISHRAPIIPFVTVGSAEIFPILGKIESRFVNRYAEWPYIPLTPTFPILPLPLPSKWHTKFLSPIHVERMYPPEAAQDRSVVKAISLDVRTQMQQAVDDMLSRRRSAFRGSIFEPEVRS